MLRYSGLVATSNRLNSIITRTAVRAFSILPLACALSITSCGGSSTHLVPPSSSPAAASSTAPNAIATQAPALLPTNATPAPIVSAASTQSVPVTLQLALASPNGQAFRLNQSTSSARARRIQAISPSNTSITINVTPLNGTPTTFGPFTCTPGSCTATFTATPGPSVLSFVYQDASSRLLAEFTQTAVIQPSIVNTLNYTANPVVSSIQLQLASPSVPAGTATNDLITVNALDASSNVIVGNANYVDVNGNPLTIQISSVNVQAGGRGNINLKGPTRIIGPTHAALYATYDGQWFDHSTISATTSNPSLVAATSTTLTTALTTYGNWNGHATHTYSGSSQPTVMTTGPDGNVWFAEPAANKIGRIGLNSPLVEFTIPTATAMPYGITVGPDGNIWFTEENVNKIGQVSLAGAFNEYTVPTGNTKPYGITTGPDGAIWFTESNSSKIGRVDLNGNIQEFPISFGGGKGIATGPDGNLWVTGGNTKIGRVTPLGSETDFLVAGANLNGIVVGADGNMWFSDENSAVGNITMNGAVTRYTIAGTSPGSIIAGPDGNIWLVAYATFGGIYRVTPSGTITNYSGWCKCYRNGGGVTIGPDGNIWYPEYNTTRLDVVVP